MNEIVGIYGGTFDPCTVGHLQVIKKACSIFDKLFVVVATASNKNPMFDVYMRRAMLQSTIPQEMWDASYQDPKVEIVILPEGVYLATYAKELGANFLVRGLRDAFDFHYEHQIYKTNKYIESEIETIYLMPDEEFSLVSSSWVKGLIGHKGWRKTIRPYVSEYTLIELSMEYARKRFQNMADNPELFLKKNPDWNTERFWNERYVIPLHRMAYHNVFHVLDCLEAMDLYYPQFGKVMEFAFWMHDIDPSEDKSITIAKNALRFASNDVINQVVKLINATKHSKSLTGKYSTEDEQVFASIDLLCLSLPWRLYEIYRDQVYKEYFNKDNCSEDEFHEKWLNGRTNFLKSMLARDQIYPWKRIRDEFEGQAMENMAREMKEIERCK